jgi:outer membrane protein TolC
MPHLTRTLVIATALAVAAPAARAAPGLDDFLRAGRAASLDVRERAAVADESAAAIAVARAALWPRLSATTSFVRNQHEVIVRIPAGTSTVAATITPSNQLEATVQLDVPLLDLGARRRIHAAQATDDASLAQTRVASGDVERAIVRAYYQWVGGSALAEAAAGAARSADDNLRVLTARAGAGLAKDLDVARARAQVARAAQTSADAAAAIASARRSLIALTGLAPGGDAPALPDDVSAEAPIERWVAAIDQLPEVAAAAADRRAAEAREAAERLTLVPTVGAFARERLTNAAGFGDASTWAVGVTATWQVDRASFARRQQTAAATATGAVRVARAGQDARDRIDDAWHQVEALRARVTAAAAQADADRLAAAIAKDKLPLGQATTLDVVVAATDALDGDVALIQARADLAAARALLRLAAGVEAAR